MPAQAPLFNEEIVLIKKEVPLFNEVIVSQIPALRLLMAMGYTYLTPERALVYRDGRRSRVILEDILLPWLRANNRVETKGKSLNFSESNLKQAVEQLRDEPFDGLMPTSQRMYELLTLGTSLKQTVDGDSKSHSLHYIDWKHPERNIYHVTDEFPVERRGSHETRRPDIVLFVNGIPLVVIECKRPDLETEKGKAFEEAVSQMLRNQNNDEIPYLFQYSQLLFAVSTNDAAYATTGTSAKYWTLWKEERLDETALAALCNQPLTDEDKARLYGWRQYATWTRTYFDALDAAGDRLPTPQDQTLYALLRPERLLQMTYQYILYDAMVKKIARYQQYFAVEATIRRVAHLTAQNNRKGGVIWHTTGTGKSLVMVLLAKALALHPNIRNPKVVVVTDRINLDKQISGTFKTCGKQVARANSGNHLMKLVRDDKVDIITTIIDKFETVAQNEVRDPNADVFILVDESHRSQYGTAHAKMRQVFPNACLIGFTGTPLLSKDKSTAAKFGGFIHTYPMRQAVEDGVVTPLLYEGRMAELDVDQAGIDTWFERVTDGLTDDQKLDLKYKFSRKGAISNAERRLQQIAYDISTHYKENFQEHSFKAQLATSSKAVALKYKQYLDNFDYVTSEVVISAPDTREGHTEVDAKTPELEEFWKRMMQRYGSEKTYNDSLIASFGDPDGVEILIVVDKLLVGFDEPRNTVLYIDKSLREHALLQAIARVNRLFEGKDFGYIIDYRGVLGELNEAMETYDALAGFDPEDLQDTFSNVGDEIANLPQKHSELWAVFNPVPNKHDIEAMQQFLAPEDIRHKFYDALSAYTKLLKVALSSVIFYEQTPEKRIKTYKEDLCFFHNLRVAVKQRYAESIDYGDYEARVSKLLDSHISSSNVAVVVPQVDIFNVQAFQEEVDKLDTPAARADTIAHRLQRTIAENIDKDPAFYERFSKMIAETIAAYREGRISEAEYLENVTEALHAVQQGHDETLPDALYDYPDAQAYYGVIQEMKESYHVGNNAGDVVDDDVFVDIAINLDNLIGGKKITDWTTNLDVQSQMKSAMMDVLYQFSKAHQVPLSVDDMEVITEKVIDIARRRDVR